MFRPTWAVVHADPFVEKSLHISSKFPGTRPSSPYIRPSSLQPTNHLDLPSIDALKLALQGYGGGIVLASHDQALISDILESSGSDVDGDLGGGGARGELWEVKGHRVRRRDGGVEEYVEEVARQAEQKEARRKVADGK